MNATVCQIAVKAMFKLRVPLLALGIAGLASSASAAASYCTAVYSVQYDSTGNNPTVATAINPATGAILKTVQANGEANAAALNPKDGYLYYFDRATNNSNPNPTLYKIDPNAASSSSVLVGMMNNKNSNTITNADGTTRTPILVGATFDNSGNLMTYWNDKTISTVDLNGLKFGPFIPVKGNNVNTIATNGDIAYDSSGQLWAIIDDTNKSALLVKLSLSTDNSAYGFTTSTPITDSSGKSITSINGLAIDSVATPNKFYISVGGNLYSLASQTNGTATATGSLPNVTDLASCGVVPNLPTLSKGFSPNPLQTPSTTTTLTITVGNSNLAPYYLNSNLTDTMPTGMTVNTGSLGGGCVGASISTDLTTITLPKGSTIPKGGCTITATVSVANKEGSYLNTIASDNLQTTSGTVNTLTSATLTVNGVPNIVLSKLVRNIGTQLNPAPQSAAAFSNTGVSALPGSYLEYCINYQNTGTGRVTNLIINDPVASTTTGQLDGYGTGTGVLFASGAAVANGATADPSGTAMSSNGTLSATKLSYSVGNLAAGAQGSVCFKAKVS